MNFSKSYSYLTQATCSQIFAKQYLLFWNFNFTMKGASDEDDILSFFPSYDLYFYHTKNQLRLSPPSGFSRHLSLFWPVSLCQPWLKTIEQNIWVIIFTKSAKLSVLEVPSVRNNCLLLDTFCTFKSPIGPLNL